MGVMHTKTKSVRKVTSVYGVCFVKFRFIYGTEGYNIAQLNTPLAPRFDSQNICERNTGTHKILINIPFDTLYHIHCTPRKVHSFILKDGVIMALNDYDVQ